MWKGNMKLVTGSVSDLYTWSWWVEYRVLVDVQEVTWDYGGSVWAEDYWKGNENAIISDTHTADSLMVWYCTNWGYEFKTKEQFYEES